MSIPRARPRLRTFSSRRQPMHFGSLPAPQFPDGERESYLDTVRDTLLEQELTLEQLQWEQTQLKLSLIDIAWRRPLDRPETDHPAMSALHAAGATALSVTTLIGTILGL